MARPVSVMSKAIAVFASGTGSNLQALIDAIDGGRLGARVTVVVSDVPHAPALTRAARHGIPAMVIAPEPGETREAYAARIVSALKVYPIDLICLAGFMRVLGQSLLDAYPRRIINIHPALLPAYPGLRAIERAFADGLKETGCTIHYVDGGIDTGPLIAQARVPIHADDTLETLTARVHAAEHALYPQTIQNLLNPASAS